MPQHIAANYKYIQITWALLIAIKRIAAVMYKLVNAFLK